MSEATVTISLEEFIHLQGCESDFLALENAGVDNWDGHGEADWESGESQMARLIERFPEHEQAIKEYYE